MVGPSQATRWAPSPASDPGLLRGRVPSFSQNINVYTRLISTVRVLRWEARSCYGETHPTIQVPFPRLPRGTVIESYRQFLARYCFVKISFLILRNPLRPKKKITRYPLFSRLLHSTYIGVAVVGHRPP